jgi:hypothetical protein
MMVRNKVCYTRKKQRRLHEKELKKEEKPETFKKLKDH